MRCANQKRAGRLMRLGAAGACAGLALFAAAASLAGSVTTYHNSITRHGLYTVPGLTASAAASMRLDRGFQAVLSGDMHAQPLYWVSKGGTRELIAATENNVVYALNPATGAIIWHKSLPPPITSRLPCGNIKPAGITGTPVIDPATDTLYLNSQTIVKGAPKHMLYALSLANGSVLPGWPIDVQAVLSNAGVSFDPAPQGARSALLFFEGALYSVYGGRSGDCGTYRGTIVQIDPSTRTLTGNWETRADRGGIWSQGGISGDGRLSFHDHGQYVERHNLG